MDTARDTRTSRAIWAALGVLVALRLVYSVFAPPLPDEAYYWLWGQRLDWSYFDHPPLQAWFQGLVSAVFGHGLWQLRLPPLLSTLAIVLALIRWARRLNQPAAATVALALASPLIHIYTTLAFNDHLMLALVMWASFPAAHLLSATEDRRRPRPLDFYLLGALVGLAGLAKYNAMLFVLGLLAASLVWARYRRIWTSPHLYGAIALAACCALPILIWNVEQDWASFRYNLSDRMGAALTLSSLADRFAGFAVVFAFAASPVICIAVWSLSRAAHTAPRRLALAVFVTATVTCLALLPRTPVLFYWNIVALVPLLPMLPGLMTGRRSRAMHLTFGILVAMLHLANYALLPLAALSGSPDRESALVHGWTDIAEIVTAAQAEHDAPLVIGTDYRIGALAAFHMNDPDVMVIEARRSQFTLWREGVGDLPATILISDAAFQHTTELAAQFASITQLRTVEVRRFGRLLKTYTLSLGTPVR